MKKNTLVEVAEESGYSTNTVSRYINKKGYISKKAAVSIQEAIDKLNYYPSFGARTMKKAKSNIISIIVLSIKNDFYVGLIRAADEFLVKMGYSTIVFDCKNNSDNVDKFIKQAASFRVDGVITVTGNNLEFEKLVSSIKKDYGIQFVIIEDRIKKLNCDFVSFKNIKGSYLLVDHLIKKHNRKRIGGLFLKGRNKKSERFKGYLKALRENGIDFDENIVLFDSASKLNGYKMTREILKKDVDAIFTENTIFGIGSIKAIHESGLSYPKDLSFVTFDDYDINTLFHPYITSLKKIDRKFGVIAVELLLDRIKNPDKNKKYIELDMELEIRESCGCS